MNYNINKFELSGEQPKDGWIFECFHCKKYTSHSFILSKTNYEIYMCKTCHRKNNIN